jgi:hypothetical protein
MFITTGKSLFGNTGLLLSLLILIILVYFSYNKCYVNSIENFAFDPVTGLSTTDPKPLSLSNSLTPPKDLRIKISGNSIIISFTIDTSITNIIPKSFIVVLAQYDSNKNNTGNNKFYLSNEDIINPELQLSKESQASQIAGTNLETNLCNIINGVPYCKYIYNDIDIKDKSGNLFYYKLGVSAIYVDGNNTSNSLYITPYNINSKDKIFTMETTVENQNTEYQNYLDYKKGQNIQSPISANTYSDTISTADGQYELIKSQLGNYPDNLLLDSQTINKGTLSDIVDKSMAQALLNINVSVITNPNLV